MDKALGARPLSQFDAVQAICKGFIFMCDVLMTGLMILCSAHLLKQDLNSMGFVKAAAAAIFIGLTAFLIKKRAWSDK
jgi:uncharacterized membrane protein YczE